MSRGRHRGKHAALHVGTALVEQVALAAATEVAGDAEASAGAVKRIIADVAAFASSDRSSPFPMKSDCS